MRTFLAAAAVIAVSGSFVPANAIPNCHPAPDVCRTVLIEGGWVAACSGVLGRPRPTARW